MGCDKKLTETNKNGVSLLTTPSDNQVSGALSFDGAVSKFTPYTWRNRDFFDGKVKLLTNI